MTGNEGRERISMKDAADEAKQTLRKRLGKKKADKMIYNMVRTFEEIKHGKKDKFMLNKPDIVNMRCKHRGRHIRCVLWVCNICGEIVADWREIKDAKK